MDNVLLDGSTLSTSLARLAKAAPRSLASFPGCQEAITAIDVDAAATATAGDAHVFTPTAFLRRPTQVLRYFSEHRGSVMTGPNFSYDYLLDAATPERLAAMDLTRWRVAFNGAEPVNPATVRRFADALAGSGVDPSVMYPVYGMAEATLAISFPTPGSIARTVDIQYDSLGTGSAGIRVAGAGRTDVKQAVSVGRPVHGMEVRIADGGATGGGNRLGEIQIRGEAVTGGYYRDARATRDLFADGGWLRTGDLGFWLGGELFVMGRSKEMITVHGRNFFPEDVESIVREISGVYKKRCVAFPVAPGGCAERMGIIVEVDHGAAGVRHIQQEVAGRVAAELSLSNIDVHLVEPRWLTQTTSGKWQRAIAAKKIAAGVGGSR